MGGHADGDADLLRVAKKEVMEECGLQQLTVVSPEIFSLEVLCVDGHEKKGQYLSSHLHLNVTYLFEADPAEVGRYIHSCGFYNGKSKDLVNCAKMLLEQFNGKVPGTMEELVSLPGVGRKTANLILGDIYKQPAYVCDTHCIRITGRLGLTNGSKDPLQVERQLREVLPPMESSDFCHRMVLFGRDICTARSPKCADCPLKADCDTGKHL